MSIDEAPRSTAEIREDLAANRAKLVSSVHGLIEDVQPKNVAKRAVVEAKSFVGSAFDNVKHQVKDDHGWRVDRLIAIGGAILGSFAFLLTVRGIITRSRRGAVRADKRAQLDAGE